MLLRPPRLVSTGEEAQSCYLGVASEIFEHLVGSIVEAPDPWRALDDVRRKLSVQSASRARGTHMPALGRPQVLLRSEH